MPVKYVRVLQVLGEEGLSQEIRLQEAVEDREGRSRSDSLCSLVPSLGNHRGKQSELRWSYVEGIVEPDDIPQRKQWFVWFSWNRFGEVSLLILFFSIWGFVYDLLDLLSFYVCCRILFLFLLMLTNDDNNQERQCGYGACHSFNISQRHNITMLQEVSAPDEKACRWNFSILPSVYLFRKTNDKT